MHFFLKICPKNAISEYLALKYQYRLQKIAKQIKINIFCNGYVMY